MILLDYSQIALSNIIVQKLNDEDMIRHMILNSIRMYNKKYRGEYGQMVICADGMNTWRRDYFPEYKANRRKGRSETILTSPLGIQEDKEDQLETLLGKK